MRCTWQLMLAMETEMTLANPMLTVGEVARRLGEKIHRIEYMIRSRRIEPSGRAWHARVFNETDLAFIAGELSRIASDRGEASEAMGGVS